MQHVGLTESSVARKSQASKPVPELPFERIEFQSPPGWTKMIDEASMTIFGAVNRSALVRAAILEYLKARGIKTQ